MTVSSAIISRFSKALRVTTQALEDAFGWLVLWLPLVPIILVSGAMIFASFSAPSSSFGLRFLAGLVTATNCFLVLFGGFFSTLFFAGYTWKLSRSFGRSPKLSIDSKVAISASFWAIGLGLTLIWLVPLVSTLNELAVFIRGDVTA